MANLRESFVKIAGWMSLCLFLFAYVAPELPVLHAGHHNPSRTSAQGEAGASWMEGGSASHPCLACLWMNQRESNADAACAPPGIGRSTASASPVPPPPSAPRGFFPSFWKARAPPAGA